MGKKSKSGDENNEKAIDSDANTSGPSTQLKKLCLKVQKMFKGLKKLVYFIQIG